jgi:hypothetical protein
MHCVGFDISYCCIIPPYNSVQAQAVRSATGGTLPDLLSGDDKVHLSYAIRDNTYSEGNKMKYFQVAKDVSGTGTMANPGDNMANYVWTHLFIYKDLEGTDYYNDYWASVVLIHFMREKDLNLPVKELVEKYLYAKSSRIVAAGWRQG